jgi:transposase InsO family protein
VFGKTRQAYYRYWYREEFYRKRDELIVREVKEFRREQPRSGGKKTLSCLRRALEQKNALIGRDRFFKVLRANHLLVKRRRKLPRTTYSRHSYAVQPNLLKKLALTGPEQAFVADITYLRLRSSFAYLFLITDAWSRKIVGYHVSTSLSHEGAKKALNMAQKNLGNLHGVIHHSDRGVQYCCHEFLDHLKKHGMRSSMTDENHCAQNALAERMNGILKDEYFLDLPFKVLPTIKVAVNDSVRIYNTKRPHWSLQLRTPDEVHNMGQLAA